MDNIIVHCEGFIHLDMEDHYYFIYKSNLGQQCRQSLLLLEAMLLLPKSPEAERIEKYCWGGSFICSLLCCLKEKSFKLVFCWLMFTVLIAKSLQLVLLILKHLQCPS